MNKKNSGGINVGTSSILVTFVILCLVTFAALTYMSARSDYRLSQQTAQREVAYYDANRMAELYLENIESQLSKLASKCNSRSEYFDKIPVIFEDNDIIIIEGNGEDILINYTISVTESQNLNVSLSPNYEGDSDLLFDIVKWQTSTNSEYIDDLKKNAFEDNGTGLLF